MQHYLTLAGRATAVVNLDPANDAPPYAAAVDVAQLVDLAAVMDAHGLGPNGGERDGRGIWWGQGGSRGSRRPPVAGPAPQTGVRPHTPPPPV